MRQCFVIAAIVCLAIACSKDNDEPLRKFTSFRVDGQIVIAENPSALLTPANLTDSDPNNDFPTLTITATSSGGDQLTFNLISETDPFKKGSYLSTQQGNGMAIHYNDSAYTMLADNNNGYLAFNLFTVKDSLIEGNFSGILEDTTGTLSLRPVTDGYLRAIIKRN
jgi:hypothetical protein